MKNIINKFVLWTILTLSLCNLTSIAYSQHKATKMKSDNACQAKWIWYPGDFEIWLHTKISGKRQERGQPYPPFWRVDSPYGLVLFRKTYEIEKSEAIRIFANGRFHVRIDGIIQYDFDPLNFKLPKGKHSLEFLIENYNTFPSLLVEGNSVFTDENWLVTNQDNTYYKAVSGDFTKPLYPPTTFSLEYLPITAKIVQKKDRGLLLDFEKETFGKVIIKNLTGKGRLKLFYGETKQEALACTRAETFDYLDIDRDYPVNDTTESRAFRYINAIWDDKITFDELTALYEYLPLKKKGNFVCSDSLLNKVYDVSFYTLQLTTREFHLDGIKRDRWIWSGDAYQSYLMNFYSFFDEDVNKRTLYALRGHEPVKTHINTILDYSFYWIIGIYDHYLYTGDTAFIKQIYPRMKTLMDFCLDRRNENGLMEGLPGDWVFIDWSDIDKEGEVSFEQILFIRSLEATSLCANLAGDQTYAQKCKTLSKDIQNKLFDIFWDNEKGAFVHNRKNGVLSKTINRYTNMFAVLFDYVNAEMKQKIKDNVLLNDKILKITTPYMKFYELAALCEIGEKQKAIEYVKNYWGGMLDLGATSFWETYDPEQSGDEHYAMYGRPFGKSLCHAWGANPIYLFGKYLLGVRPTSPGYKSYCIEPALAGLEWMEGKVPTPHGTIDLFMNKSIIKVKTIEGNGVLRIKSKRDPKVEKGVSIHKIDNNFYEITLDIPNKEYIIKYENIENIKQ
jgi:alpha-L-rhamnosidase